MVDLAERVWFRHEPLRPAVAAVTTPAADVNVSYALTLIAICSVIGVAVALLRRWIAMHSIGRLAQLRFRRLHGTRIIELLGGRLDPQPGSPWIDSWLDGRPIQLVAAPLEGAYQAGVLLLDYAIPVNIWHTSGDDDELEIPVSIDRSAVTAIVDELRAVGVDSVTCGVPLDAEQRPVHLLRARFADVAALPGLLTQIAPLLARLEGLATSPH